MTGNVNPAAALAELETPPAPETVDKAMVGTTGKVIDPNGVQVAAHYNNHPSGVEAIELCRYMNFNVGNAFKYVFRREEKPEPGLTLQESIAKNLDKALWYIRDEIAAYEGTPISHIPNPDRFRLLIETEAHSEARACYIAFETLCNLEGASPDALKVLETSIVTLKASLA